MQTTLTRGWRGGLLAGLGAACADACYGLIGALGLNTVLSYFVSLQLPLACAGAGFMFYLARQIWHSTPPTASLSAAPENADTLHLQSFLKVFLLTLSNPMTILSFIAIFAGLNPAQNASSTTVSALVMVSGVLLGSALWWLFLVGILSAGRALLSPSCLLKINRGSALIMVGFASWQLLRLLP